MTVIETVESPRYADLSQRQWMTLHALVQAHIRLAPAAIDGLSARKGPVVPP